MSNRSDLVQIDETDETLGSSMVLTDAEVIAIATRGLLEKRFSTVIKNVMGLDL